MASMLGDIAVGSGTNEVTMALPIEDLTPRQIVAELDRYIVGQNSAKRAVAVALRNRFRRQRLPHQDREDILPKNILMIGPTGVGKTEIARRLAQLARAPFIKVEATKFTEVGYVGRDVESMIRDLVASALRLVEREKLEQVRPTAERRAIDRIVDMLMDEPTYRPRKRKRPPMAAAVADNPLMRQAYEIFGKMEDGYPEDSVDFEKEDASRTRRRRKLRQEVIAGKHDSAEVEIEVEESSNPFLQVFTPQGLEEMGLDMSIQGPLSGRRITRRMTVVEAKQVLTDQEARRTFDQAALQREAVIRTEQTGIIFLDELDKVVSRGSSSGPDVSREGVQRDMLPIIEGSTVPSKFGPVRTDHILFIAAGAFHLAKPSDLIPELQGRLPIRVELDPLSEGDFRKILSEPKNALVTQYQKLLSVEGVTVTFTQGALDEIARFATLVNQRTENIGARRLHTLMEKLLEDILFEAPDVESKELLVDEKFVQDRLGSLVENNDLSRYIL